MKGEHTIGTLCAVLQVARSGYYRWRGHRPSQRAQADAQLACAHHRGRHNYGVPRIVQELRADGSGTRRGHNGSETRTARGSSNASSENTQRCWSYVKKRSESRQPRGACPFCRTAYAERSKAVS